MARPKKEKPQEPLEKQLWSAADKLRKNIDAAEYKHVVLGLIFLKYISDAFEALHATLAVGEGEYEGADPEDRDEYLAQNIFFVPVSARWSHLRDHAKQPDIGVLLDKAMEAIEQENSELAGVLPKVYARPNLDPANLGGLIDLVSNIAFGDTPEQSADVLGHVFEYFLGEFALAEGKKGGQFYTPRSIVELLVAMLEPFRGRVMDPCCGSGGMFVQSEQFVREHQGMLEDLSLYGQESNQTTWRLAKMNLAIRAIDSSQVLWNNEGSFLHDAHPDVRVEYILANPPFKGSLDADTVSADLLKVCKTKKTELLFLALFLRMLRIGGRCACIVPDGVLFGSSTAHKAIRKELVEGNRLEAVISMPSGVFKPYAGVSTAILVFTKTGHGGTDNVWFYDMQADGFSLDDKRSPVQDNDIPDIIARFRNIEGEKDRQRTEKSFFVPKTEIAENGYDLSINKYKKTEYIPVEYPPTSEIMAQLRKLEKQIGTAMDELDKMLQGEK